MKTTIAILFALLVASSSQAVAGCRAETDAGFCVLCKSTTYSTMYTITASVLTWKGAEACDATVADFAETDGNCRRPYYAAVNTATYATFALAKVATDAGTVNAVAMLKAGACRGAKRGYRTSLTYNATTFQTTYAKTLVKCAIADCDACSTTSSGLENAAASTSVVFREQCTKCGGSDMTLKSDGSTCIKDKKPTVEVKNCNQYIEYNSDVTKNLLAGKNYCSSCDNGHVYQLTTVGTGTAWVATGACPEFKVSTCNVEGCSVCNVSDLTDATQTDGKVSGSSLQRARKNRCTTCHEGWYMDFNTSLCVSRAGFITAFFGLFLVLFLN